MYVWSRPKFCWVPTEAGTMSKSRALLITGIALKCLDDNAIRLFIQSRVVGEKLLQQLGHLVLLELVDVRLQPVLNTRSDKI